ncbi:MAG: UDP-N-acetyl-D-glucosamine dehydrogenase, partial [Acidobacteria bacterium]|nr:UDP-N-acetyl-D-glucosamine dehydrogenase [Acidobacteriota bacterium]
MGKVAVIGLGYVGLPLALAFAEAGEEVYGIDVDAERVSRLAAGRSHVEDVSDDRLQRLLGRFHPTQDAACLRDADAAIICVPTPLRKTRDPDISFIIAASELVGRHLHPGMLVVLESTTYP